MEIVWALVYPIGYKIQLLTLILYPTGYSCVGLLTLTNNLKEMSELIGFVKGKRAATNLTQAQLADRAGVGLRFVRDLEQGKATLRLDKVNQVLQLFGHQLGPIPIDREE